MGKRSSAVHIARVVRKYKDRQYVLFLLRRSYREGGEVKHQTLANLSALPAQAIADLRASLAGRRLVDAEEALEVTRSLPQGMSPRSGRWPASSGSPRCLARPAPSGTWRWR